MPRTYLAILAAFAAVVAPCAAAASDRSDVIGVVQAYNDAGNRGDRSGYTSYCTPDAVVVDQEPPYLFRGPTACADEYDAVVAWRAKHDIGAEELFQKLYEPVSFAVEGDTAYAVFPVKGWFKQAGRPQLENLYLTTVLRRQAGSWRIQSLVYSTLGWKPTAAPPER
jgi:ketosteroid isomerase-like protein